MRNCGRLALLATGLWVSEAGGHTITGTDVATLTQLEVDHDGITGIYELQYGEIAALDERRSMDVDGDERITAAEQADFIGGKRGELERHLKLEIDGERLPVRLGDAEVLPDESLVAPVQMTVRYALVPIKKDFTAAHVLSVSDANAVRRLVHTDISVEGMPLVDVQGVTPRDGVLKLVRVQAAEAPVSADVRLVPSEELWSGPFGGQRSAGTASQKTSVTSAGSTDRIKEMLRTERLSLGVILLALGLSVFLGAVHALEPGHGKTIVAAYLIGSKGTVANAIFLGGVVTLTHTFSVLLLGVITLFASRYILPEQIFPWLGAGSGLLIMGLGGWLFVRYVRGGEHGHSHGPGGHHHVHLPAGVAGVVEPGVDSSHEHQEHSHPHDHEHAAAHSHEHGGAEAHTHSAVGGREARHEHAAAHSHEHDTDDAHVHAPETAHNAQGGPETNHTHSHDHEDQTHGHSHSHVPQGQVTLGGLLALGITGGIVPCPGALVILLLAVALHRIALGLMVIVAFSVGLALVLITIGVLMVKARPLMDRFTGNGRFIRALPVFSSLVIIAVGFVMGVRSLMEAGIVIINL